MQSISDLVRSNIKNTGFWQFYGQEKEAAKISKMKTSYTEGHDKIFFYYGRDLSPETKWFVGSTAVLLNPLTGEIFMQDHGRFTFFLKYLPAPFIRIQDVYSLDGRVDISVMGADWSHFYGEEDDDEDASIVESVYEWTCK